MAVARPTITSAFVLSFVTVTFGWSQPLERVGTGRSVLVDEFSKGARHVERGPLGGS
jgi:hypothetical protein